MSDMLEVRDLRAPLRRRWWIPVVIALWGLCLGVLAHANSSPVYRAKGTALVGPVNSTVLRSSTLRASESLATFYADLARRQIVLEPVTKKLGLGVSWNTLRDDVSAVAADQNPRLITVTVLDGSQARAAQIADEVLKQLVALSPHPVGGTEQEFVGEQTAHLKATIAESEAQIQSLAERLARTRQPLTAADLRARITDNQRLLNEWRRAYVELLAMDTGTDAGGLQIIDEVTTRRSSFAGGATRYGGLGAVLGAIVGLALMMVRRHPRAAADEPPVRQGPAAPAEAVNGWPTEDVPSRSESRPAAGRSTATELVDSGAGAPVAARR